MPNLYSCCRQHFSVDDIFIQHPASKREYSYGDLDNESSKIAHHLTRLELVKGDRVMVQVEKSPQNLFWYFACLRAGLIYLPLNTAYKEREVEYFVNNAEPALILCDPNKHSVFKSIIDRADISCLIRCLDKQGGYSHSENMLPTSHEFVDINCNPDDIAVILYTSGTTGKPKGAMITHGNLISNSTALSQTWQWQPQDILLHSLPLFHVHGLFVAVNLAVLNGSKIILMDKFDPEQIIDWLAEASVYMGVPTHYVRLLNNQKLDESACKNMRLFTSGSAPLLPQTFSEFQQRTSHTIVERYGMTETGMNTSNPIDGQKKAGTVGLPLQGIKTMILDNSDNPVDRDTPGNLLVKGENVFKGYWCMPEKTAEEFTDDGFFKTGDIASIDSDGYISIIGRDKDMIITGGLNVYPKEIESIIDNIHGVLESAVIGLPHPDFGESVTAVIVKQSNDNNLQEQDIIQHLKMLVANFKVTKKVFFVEELPRNTMGKVQKALLREMFE